MFVLTRPRSGRLISGVALGISELYGIPVVLVRLLFVVGLLAAPVIALLYILLTISIPDEEHIVSNLTVELPASYATPRERFEASSKILFDRFIGQRSGRLWPTQAIAISLLIFAAILELPRVEGDSFYYLHPVLTIIFSDIAQWGSVLLYCVLAVTMFVAWKRPASSVRLSNISRTPSDTDSTKMIAGIASDLSQRLDIDPAYLRVLFLFLNFLTVGLAGVAYIVLTYLRRRHSSQEREPQIQEYANTPKEGGAGARILLGFFFLLYVVLQIATQYRLFFFNEVFTTGMIVLLIGLMISSQGFSSKRETSALLSIGGAGIFLTGIYLLAVSIGRIQVTIAGQFEIEEIIAGLSIVYYAITMLSAKAREIGVVLAVICIIASILIHVNLVPPRYLVAIAQFYSFFFPVIFAGLGLWITFEK